MLSLSSPPTFGPPSPCLARDCLRNCLVQIFQMTFPHRRHFLTCKPMTLSHTSQQLIPQKNIGTCCLLFVHTIIPFEFGHKKFGHTFLRVMPDSCRLFPCSNIPKGSTCILWQLRGHAAPFLIRWQNRFIGHGSQEKSSKKVIGATKREGPIC